MKKLFALATILLFSTLITKSQPDNYSTIERIVLDKRPSILSERNAYYLIIGAKKEIVVKYPNDYRYTRQDYFPFSRLNVFEKRGIVRLKYDNSGKTPPEWENNIYFVETKRTANTYHWESFIVGCIVSFFLGLAFINLISDWDLEWMDDFKSNKKMVLKRGKILLIGLVFSVIIGSLTYTIGQSAKDKDYLPGYSYGYVWKEHFFHTAGIYISGLLWIVLIHVRLFFQGLFAKKVVLQ